LGEELVRQKTIPEKKAALRIGRKKKKNTPGKSTAARCTIEKNGLGGPILSRPTS